LENYEISKVSSVRGLFAREQMSEYFEQKNREQKKQRDILDSQIEEKKRVKELQK
jgi:hypothetical protein